MNETMQMIAAGIPWVVIIIAAVVVWGQSTVGKIGGEDWEP